MRKDDRKICGTCKWKRQELPFGEAFCDNCKSDCYGCECLYDDYCMDYEEKDKNA